MRSNSPSINKWLQSFMLKINNTILSFIFLFFSLFAHAESIPTVPKYKPMTVLLAPVEAATGMQFKGAQGTVTVRLTFKDGVPEGPITVVGPSPSNMLNIAAQQLPKILELKIPPRSEALTVDMPFDLVRDSHSNLKEKPCTELNEDVDYFTEHNPGEKNADMRLYNLTLGMLVLSVDYEQRLKISKVMNESFTEVIEKCRQSPDAKYLTLLKTTIASKP